MNSILNGKCFQRDGILAAVGQTPVVELKRSFGTAEFFLFAKLEGLNPAGSVKDRAALEIIESAFMSGEIDKNSIVVESSSGNMAIGLAQVCGYYGLRLICVVDSKTTAQNISILKAYGAEIDMVSEPHRRTGDLLRARLDRVHALVSTLRGAYWPNQYSNRGNSESHRKNTMPEIVRALGPDIDYLFCATSTCGTITGCAEYIKQRGLKTKVIAVDAVGSVIFGGPPAKRLIPGHGASVRSELCRHELVDRCIHISDLECVIGCRALVRQEAILAGGSSGAVMMAVAKLKHEIPAGATCVAILPDRGERYLDTIYSDEWVRENFEDAVLAQTGAEFGEVIHDRI